MYTTHICVCVCIFLYLISCSNHTKQLLNIPVNLVMLRFQVQDKLSFSLKYFPLQLDVFLDITLKMDS